MPDILVDYKVERTCGHTAIIQSRQHQSLADYNGRLVPELREYITNVPCTQCEQEKSDKIKQKLALDMHEKAKMK